MTPPSVLLIGTGGVGTIVAYGISYAGKANISIVVRRDYYKVKEAGWEIDSADYGHVKGWRPDHIYPDVAGAAATGTAYDFVIITTKNLPDITEVEELAGPVITTEETTIALMQNGFYLGRPFVQLYPKNLYFGSVTYWIP